MANRRRRDRRANPRRRSDLFRGDGQRAALARQEERRAEMDAAASAPADCRAGSRGIVNHRDGVRAVAPWLSLDGRNGRGGYHGQLRSGGAAVRRTESEGTGAGPSLRDQEHRERCDAHARDEELRACPGANRHAAEPAQHDAHDRRGNDAEAMNQTTGAAERSRYARTVAANRRTPSSIRSCDGAENERRAKPLCRPSTKNALPATYTTRFAMATSSIASVSTSSPNDAQRKKPPLGAGQVASRPSSRRSACSIVRRFAW